MEPVSIEITAFNGFMLSVGRDDVHAIEVVDASGSISDWLGNALGVASTRSLFGNGIVVYVPDSM